MATDAKLPQLSEGPFLTDGGIETTLIFHRGIDLPDFAAFVLLEDDDGLAELRRYYEPYIALARERDLGFVLESPTWRASQRWGDGLGYSAERLDKVNRRAIELMQELRDENADAEGDFVVSGCIGPQGDGYSPEELLSAEEAQAYHSAQIASFAAAGADLVAAITMTYPEEAIGVARAAAEAGIPSAISFTVEKDGRLPNGESLGEAIERTDAETGGAPAYYMLNCAHPTHFDDALDGPWTERIAGLRANASTMSHAELDEAEELDDGDPEDLGRRYAQLREQLPRLSVVGGCCGTDDRHVAQIATAWQGTGS
jgi:S-methylmethionine-dependent homocysteine/selenocysteine methylase